MSLKKMPFAALLFVLFISLQVSSQTSLPRSTPEAEGVSSKAILEFLAAANSSKHEFHSIMILRHGKVIAEGWWKPYRSDLKHTLYSVSKSFTSTAVGFAVSEKRLSVNDKVVSFFPNELPAQVSPYLAELTVKDVLSMSVGQDPDPTGLVVSTDSNWVKRFLALPMIDKPGSKFLYNSLGTYMLSAIVQKVTGQKIIDYLQPRLFQPLGIKGVDWEKDPKGINVGGWGLRVKTEDLAKFGQLYLQKGKWKGKQILPAAWIEEATTLKIEQTPDFPQIRKDSSDWRQGYCYQFWRSRHNTYRGDGAFGQYILVWPEQDAVIAITAETGDMQGEINLVWDHLFPAFQNNNKLPVDSKTQAALKQKLSVLALPLPAKGQLVKRSVSGNAYSMLSNGKNIKTISFSLKDNVYTVAIRDDKSIYNIPFGRGNWKSTETTRRGPSLVAQAKGHFEGLPPTKVVGSYIWKNDSTLELTLRYIESPHTERMTCRFDGTIISIETQHSFNPNAKIPVLTGELIRF